MSNRSVIEQTLDATKNQFARLQVNGLDHRVDHGEHPLRVAVVTVSYYVHIVAPRWDDVDDDPAGLALFVENFESFHFEAIIFSRRQRWKIRAAHQNFVPRQKFCGRDVVNFRQLDDEGSMRPANRLHLRLLFCSSQTHRLPARKLKPFVVVGIKLQLAFQSVRARKFADGNPVHGLNSDAGFSEEGVHGFARLRAFFDPRHGFVRVNFATRLTIQRVVGSENLEKSAVSWHAGIRRHDAIKRFLLCSPPR